jgi:hypothetical protein
MIVRAHLDWPVAGIGDLDRDLRGALVEDDFTRLRNHFARDHGVSSWRMA